LCARSVTNEPFFFPSHTSGTCFLMTRSCLLARVPLLNYAYWWSSRLLISFRRLLMLTQLAYRSLTDCLLIRYLLQRLLSHTLNQRIPSLYISR
jgi:hypothetical protein